MVVLKFKIAFSYNKFMVPVLVLLRSSSLYSPHCVSLHDMDKLRHSAHPCVVVHWGSVVLKPSQILSLVAFLWALSCLTYF